MNGQIEMIKLDGRACKQVTTLKGHSSSIHCLAWDSSSQLLFSGGSDKIIICWDIGGKKGTAYELQGHQCVYNPSLPNRLMTFGQIYLS